MTFKILEKVGESPQQLPEFETGFSTEDLVRLKTILAELEKTPIPGTDNNHKREKALPPPDEKKFEFTMTGEETDDI